jgi:hypothetical protein
LDYVYRVLLGKWAFSMMQETVIVIGCRAQCVAMDGWMQTWAPFVVRRRAWQTWGY